MADGDDDRKSVHADLDLKNGYEARWDTDNLQIFLKPNILTSEILGSSIPPHTEDEVMEVLLRTLEPKQPDRIGKEKLPIVHHHGYEEPSLERMALFDGFIALFCSPDRAECALAELDYMWDTVWSVRFPRWFAHIISFKNAVAIGLGGLISRIAKIGFIAGVIGTIKSLFGNYSI